MEVTAGTIISDALRQAYYLSDMNSGASVELNFNGVGIHVQQAGGHHDDTRRDAYLSDLEERYHKELDRLEKLREAQERSLIVPVADVLALVELSQVSQKRGRWLDVEISRANKIVGKMPTEYQAKFRSTMELPLGSSKK